MKITKRKEADSSNNVEPPFKRTKHTETTSEEPKLATASEASFHTIDHLLLRDWVYDDTGSGDNGLSEELRVDSSPAFSRVKLDLGSSDSAIGSKQAISHVMRIYKIMENQLLWYWGDSDCNWFPFVVKCSLPQERLAKPIISALRTSLGLGTEVGPPVNNLDFPPPPVSLTFCFS